MKYTVEANVFSEKAMTIPEAAYVAGIVDGEGCISLARSARKRSTSGYRYQPLLSICNTNRGLIETIQQMMGNGRIQGTSNPKKPNHRDSYVLKLAPNQIRHVLPQLRHYLVAKQRQADLLLEYLADVRVGNHLGNDVNRIEAIRAELRTLNARGADSLFEFKPVPTRPSKLGNNQWKVH